MAQELNMRVQILETKMDFFENNSIQKIYADLDILKRNQFTLLEKFGDLQSHMDERISSSQTYTDGRISSLQAHMDERFAHMDERFLRQQEQFSEIHRAIATQTRWILVAILAASTMISILHPLILKFL